MLTAAGSCTKSALGGGHLCRLLHVGGDKRLHRVRLAVDGADGGRSDDFQPGLRARRAQALSAAGTSAGCCEMAAAGSCTASRLPPALMMAAAVGSGLPKVPSSTCGRRGRQMMLRGPDASSCKLPWSGGRQQNAVLRHAAVR